MIMKRKYEIYMDNSYGGWTHYTVSQWDRREAAQAVADRAGGPDGDYPGRRFHVVTVTWEIDDNA